MEVQFGDKPKPPSSLWHMIKICFVLICYSQIPHCCWHCKLRLHGCPWITVQLFLLFFLLISTEPRKCHLHLVEKLHLQTLGTKCVIEGLPPTATPPRARMLLSRNTSPWRFGNTRGEVSLTRLQVRQSAFFSSWLRGFHYSSAEASKTKRGWGGCS